MLLFGTLVQVYVAEDIVRHFFLSVVLCRPVSDGKKTYESLKKTNVTVSVEGFCSFSLLLSFD